MLHFIPLALLAIDVARILVFLDCTIWVLALNDSKFSGSFFMMNIAFIFLLIPL